MVMSFKLKTILGVALIEGCLLLVLVLLVSDAITETENTALNKRAHAITNVLASTAMDAVIANDLATLGSFSAAVLNNPDIVYVKILDDANKVMVQSGSSAVLAKAFVADSTISQSVNDGVFDVWADIGTSEIQYGRIELGLDSATLLQSIETIRNKISAIALVEMGLVALFSLFLGTYLTRQLVQLKAGVQRIEQGGFGYEVDKENNDEVGGLIESFNAMSRQIAVLYDDAQQQANYHKKVVNSVLDGILTTTPDGIIIDANPATETIFGYSLDELVGQNVKLLVPMGEHHNNHDNYLDSIRKQNKAVISLKRSVKARHKDGHLFPAEISITGVIGSQGKPELFIAMVEDISLRQKTEDELRQAKEAAETANSAKSRFLATMTHELRTPMNGVIGMLQLLESSGLDSRQQEYILTAKTSSHLLMSIINEILDFSKLEAGKLELEALPFNPVELIEETATIIASTAYAKGLELVCRLDPGLPLEIEGDPTKIQQIIVNIVGNAVKFTQQGDIVISASYRNNRFRIDVADTGIGIEQANQQSIFDTFTQADSSTTRNYGGTGLGLSICSRLIQAMGGDMALESEINKGSTFSVALPLAVVTPAPAPVVLDMEANIKVLIVNENKHLSEVLLDQLQTWGITQSQTTCNADEALRYLTEAAATASPFTVALIDEQVQNVTGLSLVETIREASELDNLKTYVLASPFSQQTIPESLTACIRKPVMQTGLKQAFFENQAASPEPSQEEKQEEHQDDSDRSYHSRHLLLVDDNQTNLLVAKSMLARVGFNVETRLNGEEAVSAVQSHDYDAVLMDLQMPVMDGHTATQKIRALGGKFATLPILAVTAHAHEAEITKCKAVGMNAHISKPLDISVMLKTLSKFVAADELSRSSASSPPGITTPYDLPGIDVASVLQRMHHDDEGLRLVFRLFREQQGSVANELHQCLLEGDFHAAASKAHTLKGSSGNIGATTLFEQASEMERLCLEGNKKQCFALIGDLQASMTEVIDGLVTLDSSASLSEPLPEQQDCNLCEVITKLASYLDDDVSEAMATLKQCRLTMMGAGFGNEYTKLDEALNNFDIALAKQTIIRLQENLALSSAQL